MCHKRLFTISLLVTFGLTSFFPLIAQSRESKIKSTATYGMPANDDYLKLAAEMETTLQRDVLGVWFPRSVDEHSGGFYSNFNREWKRTESEGKFSVFQGRMVWVAAQVLLHHPEMKSQYQPILEHGFQYLNDVLWDKNYGGFYWGLDEKNQISTRYTDGKHLYGISFGLYGATAAYKATNDQRALILAQKTFHWIDSHAHDDKNGGYFEWLSREGNVVQPRRDRANGDGIPVAGFPIGYKSMNTHIHLLESFTQLYEVWRDDRLRQRLSELLEIIGDKICVEPGAMNLYFTPEWRPVPDHDSYGHDVETAFLMLEAESELGSPQTKTELMAKLLVDHALRYGWDATNGGFYRDGTAFGAAEDKRKEWWVQFEGLNALLLMHQKYGRDTDSYFKAFREQWKFIKDHQVDQEFGGVFDTVEADGRVTDYTKSRIWKECYHETRALFNTIDRLRELAKRSGQPQ